MSNARPWILCPRRILERCSGVLRWPVAAAALAFTIFPGPAPGAGTYDPDIELRQSVSSISIHDDGTFSFRVILTVTNTGNEKLSRLQLKDNLDIFGDGADVDVRNVTVLKGNLSLNPGFNGLSNVRLLQGVDTLDVDQQAKLRFEVRVRPGESGGPFTNTAIAWAEGKHSGKAADDRAKCTFSVRWQPVVHFKKSVIDTVYNPTGTFTAQIELYARNTGNEALIRIQIKDDLDIFGDGEVVSVSTPELVEGDLVLNREYDGIGDIRLLSGINHLATGEDVRIRFSVTFDPAGESGPFTNRSLFWSEGKYSGKALDVWKKDRIHLPVAPAMRFVKDATDGVSIGGGVFRSTITLDVTNTGNEEVRDLQLKDDLGIFGSGEIESVGPVEVLTDNLTLRSGYDGVNEIRILAGADRLAIGEQAVVRFEVLFRPGSESGPFKNRALAWARGSVSGKNLDVWGSDQINLPVRPAPAIDLTNTAGPVTRVDATTQTVQIELIVENTGDEDLNSLLLEDSLDIFGSGMLKAPLLVSAPGLTPNPNYNGISDIQLLAGTDMLPVSESRVVTITVLFDPAGEPGPFIDNATTAGTGEITGETVTDSDDSNFLPLPPPPVPVISLEKLTDSVTDNGDGTLTASLILTVINDGTEDLDGLMVEDDLDIFGDGLVLQPVLVNASGLTVNPDYDGIADVRILDGSDGLSVGEERTIELNVRFNPRGESGPFFNKALASGVGEMTGEQVEDSAEAEIVRPLVDPGRPPVISISKTVDREFVSRGELVSYDVSVTNIVDFTLYGVKMIDDLPAGFLFVEDSGQIVQPDGNTEEINTQGLDPVVFPPFDLAPGETIVFRYLARVGTGIANGDHTNTVTVTPGFSGPQKATAMVTIIADPMFEKTTVIGKVFHDRDNNGLQDYKQPDYKEPGIPGVRLATVSGLTMETDAEGRFHLADVDVDRFERGGNFIIKLDTATLPQDATVLSENPRVLRITEATMSKVNFRISMPESPAGPCFESCITLQQRVVTTEIEPVRFASGSYDLPENIGEELLKVYQQYGDRPGFRFLFVGHTDADPVVGRLATTLEASGEAGNVILARRRAELVCKAVDREVSVPIDCTNLQGMGSEDPVASNFTEAGKALNRRVEIQVEFLESLEGLVHSTVNPQLCADLDAKPYDVGWFDGLFDDRVHVESRTECSIHTGPVPEKRPESATARRVIVSGGRFGCDTLIADTLNGRNPDGTPGINSEVTVYAQEDGEDLDVGRRCSPSVRAGQYPIEAFTADGSRLMITNAGDVLRIEDPQNHEHIVIVPIRDETRQSIITALRITNDGVEPVRDEHRRHWFDGWNLGQVRASSDLDRPDPRLDVVAIDDALLDEQGTLARPIRFAAYTNYSFYGRRYALDVYASRRDAPERKILESVEVTDLRYDRPLVFVDDQTILSGYDQLEYVLRASSCPDSFDRQDCEVDSTRPRLLALKRLRAAADTDIEEEDDAIRQARLRASAAVWGKNNLATQHIQISTGKARVYGTGDSDQQVHRLNGVPVPVGSDGRYVLEEHLPPAQYDVTSMTDESFAEQVPMDPVTADATNLYISGGPFGCGRVLTTRLPGRDRFGDAGIPAVIAVADPEFQFAALRPCGDAATGSYYPITLRTAEGTHIQVHQGGDVRTISFPLYGSNYQQIVVTPIRDDTDPTIVTALRITNEGFHYDPNISGFYVPHFTKRLDTTTPDYKFFVGLANLTVGRNNVSGNQATLGADPHFDGSTFVDGRLAFYAKRRTQDYTLTAQLDSTEDELKNFSDNLKRKNPRRVFRQLDPNRFYPMYGDDSTTTTDVDTQGALYMRLDWDRNMALWGNYNSGLTDTEFLQYNRSLYGANVSLESESTTSYGDAKSRLTLFGSEAQSVPAHVTFRATGGSLYYLRDTDIVEGSEKAWIEVRRRDTGQVLEREVLLEGRDYEVDALQGRIILRRPLSQVVNESGPAIIRSAPLEGDEVYLLVDYEFVPRDFDPENLTYGGRGVGWLTDFLAIGATKVVDQRDGTDYDMEGVDATVKGGEGTYLSVEYGRSTARQSDANYLSLDGGMTFSVQTSGGAGDTLDGDASAIEGRIDFNDFKSLQRLVQGDIRAWSKQRDAEFSTGRLAQGQDIKERGIEAQLRLGEGIEVLAGYTDVEQEQLLREQVARLQVKAEFDKWHGGVEIRHEEIEVQDPSGALSRLSARTGDGEAVLVGARIGYDLSDETSAYAAVQTVADDKGAYGENDLATVGVNSRLNDRAALSVEVSDGDRGSALTAGLDLSSAENLDFNLSGGIGSGAISQFASRYSIAGGLELYGSYAVDPDRTEGARNLLTLGQRRAFGNKLSIFTETQFGKDDRYANAAHVFGLNLDGVDDWRFSASAQFSEVDEPDVAFERQTLSLGAYFEREDLRMASRLEFRQDEGLLVHRKQYVTSNSFTWQLDDNTRWLGQLNLSWSDDELDGGKEAKFVEFDAGFAHRPKLTDQLNIIGKYGYLYDLGSESQAPPRPDERSHLLSLEGIYDFNDWWELAAKVAVKSGERRALRDAGPWFDFGLRMAAVRARLHISRKYDALAEYRWLSDIEGDGDRHGALLGVYRHMGDNFKLGVGYNFTDFDDRLRINDYRNNGWFVDLVGKY